MAKGTAPTQSTSAPSPLSALSTTEKLLLSQAVCKVGSTDWNAVSGLLASSPLLVGSRIQFTPQLCAMIFQALLQHENVVVSRPDTGPNGRSARKLAHKLYQVRLYEIVQGLRFKHQEETNLVREIAEISAGKWDDRLIAALTPAQRALLTLNDDPPAEATPAPVSRASSATSKVARSRSRKGKLAEAETEEESDVEMVPDSQPSKGKASSQVEATTPMEQDEEEAEAEVEPVIKDKKGKGRAAAVTATGRKSTRGKPLLDEEATEDFTEDESVTAGAGEDGTVVGTDDEELKAEEEEEEIPVKKSKKKASAKSRRTTKRKTSEPVEMSPPLSDRPGKRTKTEELADDADKAGKVAADRRFKKTIAILIDTLLAEPNAHLFRNKVLKSQASNYDEIVKRPMHILEITRRLKSGLITNSKEMMRDVALIFANAVQYNGVETQVGMDAQTVWSKFEQLMAVHMTYESDNAGAHEG